MLDRVKAHSSTPNWENLFFKERATGGGFVMERDKHEVGSLLLSKTVVPNLGVGTQQWRHTMNPKGHKIIERDNEEKHYFY